MQYVRDYNSIHINIKKLLCKINNIINELFIALFNASNMLFSNLRLSTFISSNLLFLHYIFTFIRMYLIYVAILILLNFDY